MQWCKATKSFYLCGLLKQFFPVTSTFWTSFFVDTCLLLEWSNAPFVVFWFRKVQSAVILDLTHKFVRTVNFFTRNCSIQLSCWSSGNGFVSGAGGLRFKSRAGQIGHSVANGSPPQRYFLERSCVARAQWRGDGSRQLVTRFGVLQRV